MQLIHFTQPCKYDVNSLLPVSYAHSVDDTVILTKRIELHAGLQEHHAIPRYQASASAPHRTLQKKHCIIRRPRDSTCTYNSHDHPMRKLHP